MSVPSPWPTIHTEPGPDLIIFKARFDTVRNPRTSRERRVVALETPDWSNVVALTEDRRLVVVRQYRFGIGEVITEIPGGTVEPGEDPEEAARRELLEETGYTAALWTYLGASHANAAFHDNLCHHWLAEQAELTHPQSPSDGEDIVVDSLAEAEILRAVHTGEIGSSLVISALARVFDLRGARGVGRRGDGTPPSVRGPAGPAR